MAGEVKRQWPDNITSGDIRYGKSSNYDGFYLADAMHGIPTIGSVSGTSPPTFRGQHVQVFNYPGQTEEIAKALCDRWNAHTPMLEALKLLHAHIFGPTTAKSRGEIDNMCRAAISKAEGRQS